MKIDITDHRIIAELKKNSRDSIRDISKRTGIRPSTVHQRIQRLREKNIIELFTLKLNNKALGENFIVFMLINTEKEIPHNVFKNSHIKEVFGITGEYNLLIKMKFSDVSGFNEFIIKFRKEHEIKQILTMVATETIKEEI